MHFTVVGQSQRQIAVQRFADCAPVDRSHLATAVARLFLCALAFGVWLDMPNAFNKLVESASGEAVT